MKVAVILFFVASSQAAHFPYFYTSGGPYVVPTVYSSVPTVYSAWPRVFTSYSIIPNSYASAYSAPAPAYTASAPYYTSSDKVVPFSYSGPALTYAAFPLATPSAEKEAEENITVDVDEEEVQALPLATTYTAKEEVKDSTEVESDDVVHSGYVAKTKGVTHTAALPEGLGYASHHINLQDAPGTR